jgi:hypothetical protein
MGTWNPPVRAQEFEIWIGLPSRSSPGDYLVNPTIAAGDFKISKDGSSLVNLANLPTVQPAGGRLVHLSMSDEETDCDAFTIVGVDQSSPKEWADVIICIPTA